MARTKSVSCSTHLFCTRQDATAAITVNLTLIARFQQHRWPYPQCLGICWRSILFKGDFIVPFPQYKLGRLVSVNQVGMAVGNLVDICNKVKITAWTMDRHPIRELFDLLIHPVEMVSTCIAKISVGMYACFN